MWMNKFRNVSKLSKRMGMSDGRSAEMEQLEPRQMLDGTPTVPATSSSRFVNSPLDWQGVHYANWSQGSWIVTFNNDQSMAQATARARQIATALGVDAIQVQPTALGDRKSVV